MNTALLSIRTDEQTKRDVTRFANSAGLTVSALVTVLLKQALQEGRVVIEPALKPTPYLEKIIEKADEDLKAGRASSPMNRDEARKHLQSLMK